MSRTFGEARQIATKRRHCGICGDPDRPGVERGRVQITLATHHQEKLPGGAWADKKGNGWKQIQKTVASESRIVCESCSVDLYEQLVHLMPARRNKRADKEEVV